jgi:phosphatidylserine/phosphatidylglycerophosphate/cardiolipin synthase-like enzyme
MVGGRDGGADAASAQPDAAITPDAGEDGGTPAPDAGPPDGGPPPCACPPLPTSCTEPAANVPTFTPEAEAMGAQLYDVIACAESTLQIAMYEAEWSCMGAALEAALEQNPALTIEIVTDDERCAPGACLFDALDTSDRVTVVRDNRDGYMHHKWVVADGERLWVSSANFSQRSYCVDHNNAIVVDQPEIAGAYQTVFTEMLGGAFAPVPREPLVAGSYTVYFSPDSPTTAAADWQDEIVAAIEAATTRVDVLINAWTVDTFAAALVAAHERGVEVRILVSHLYADGGPPQTALERGIEVRRDNIHDKTIVIDDVVFTGSANWSVNARTNNENVLAIRDATVAAAYRARFDAQFADARPVEDATP